MAAEEGQFPWAAESISRKKDGTVAVDWSCKELTDDGLTQFATTRLAMLLEGLPTGGPAIECTVDISGNSLRMPNPLAALLRRLRQAPVHVTVLKLYNNQLVDTTSAVLAEHLREAGQANRPLMQLHMSGNALTAAGVQVLVEAAHRCGVYPRPEGSPRLASLGPDGGRRALWLRTEHQRPMVVDPVGLVLRCKENGFPVCIVPKGDHAPPAAVVQMHLAFTQADGGWFTDGDGRSLPPEAPGKGKAAAGKGEFSAHGENGAKGKGGKGLADAGKGAGKGKGSDGKAGGKLQQAGGSGKGGSYKTVLCEFFGRGSCAKGALCSYAHGEGELQQAGHAGVAAAAPPKTAVPPPPPPPPLPASSSGASPAAASAPSPTDAAGAGAATDTLYKTTLCKFFARGACEKGEKCPFAHGQDELRPPAGGIGGSGAAGAGGAAAWAPYAPSPPPSGKGAGGRGGKGTAGDRPERFKTVLCRFFEKGCCEKGDRCPFAHGEGELVDGPAAGRPVTRQEDEAMVWLKQHREAQDEEGERFEKQWKAWCREKDLHALPKCKRLESIVAFRASWEGGTPNQEAWEAGSAARTAGQRPASASSSCKASSAAAAWLGGLFDEEAQKAGESSSAAAAAGPETNEQAMLRLLGHKLRK